jgi:glycosyltransferase involved in cell wall biosynthesis
MAQPFSIVILTSASGWRGSGVSFAKIARGLAARGHRMLVVATYPQVAAGFVAEGVTVTELELRKTRFREVASLSHVLAQQHARVIMADTPRDLRLSVLAGLWRRCPVVYRYNLNHRRPRTDLAERLFAQGVTGTVFLSKFIEHAARTESVRYRGKSYLIPNGFDTEVFAPHQQDGAAFRARFAVDSEDALILTAGSLVAGKRVERGIAALSRVRLDHRRLTYVLCGDGPEQTRLGEMANRLGVRLVVTGMVDQKTLRAAYNAADIVLHTGKETFGNVVGEAMSCGRAVVCVREGAAPEVVGEGEEAGVLVPPDDAEALAYAVTGLLNDPERCRAIGVAARRRVEQVFPLQRMISGYEAMFADILARR